MKPATDTSGGAGQQRAEQRKTGGVPIRASLARLIDQKFFTETRTLPQVVVKLHEQAIIAKTTSLSGPIAEFVRDQKLERKKITEGNKDLWVIGLRPMRDAIIADLSAHLPPTLATELVLAYEELLTKHRAGDLEGALTKGGRSLSTRSGSSNTFVQARRRRRSSSRQKR